MAHTYLGVGFLIFSLQFFPCEGERLLRRQCRSRAANVTTCSYLASNLLPSGIFVYQNNPYHGEQLAAASFSIGGKEYKDVIPYFTDG